MSKKSIFDEFGEGRYQTRDEAQYKGRVTALSPRCFNSHPPLKLPGVDTVIYGGSCSTPVVKDADVYVGLCNSMVHTARAWPWKVGTEFLFPITDMSVPTSPEEFKKLIKWLKKSLDSGKKVHVGCIGGHGRTGTLLAALVSEYGEPDAIAYVRKNYCTKAVESKKQVDFLHEHFGVLAAQPAKAPAVRTGRDYGLDIWTKPPSKPTPRSPSKKSAKSRQTKQADLIEGRVVPADKIIKPMPGVGSIWGN